MKIIAFGGRELMDGFALLGIETYADANIETVERVLTELKRGRQRALVYLQQDLMQAEIPMVNELRIRGGNILICQIPNLHDVEGYRPEVEKLIRRVLGPTTLERQLGY